MAGSRIFPEFPPPVGEWGGEEGFDACAQKLRQSMTKGINMLISSPTSPFKTIVFNASSKAILC